MIDLCIVGSGVSGSLIAYEAAKAGKTVVMLETGKRYDPLDPNLYDRVKLQLYPWQWEEEDRDAFELDSSMRVRLNGVEMMFSWHHLIASDLPAPAEPVGR